jgi:REP element-mobilizing transposase RayT
MGYARKSLVSLQDTPYYHVIGPCVRRAWLWGFDEYSGKDYSHRKQWVLDRLALLSKIFALDVCAYAIMSNHYHLVVHVDQHRAKVWTAQEVIERWSVLFRAPLLIQRWQSGEATAAERRVAEQIVRLWRSRLCDVSWYMRCLNEYLARRANAEDDCTGRFWEGRFKSQALLDDTGLLTAMAYVDLNPVRAGMATTPEASDFTSIQARIAAVARGTSPTASKDTSPIKLMPFKGPGHRTLHLPFAFKDYLLLVDWTGRRVRKDKRGHIDAAQPPILERLKIDHDAWQAMMQPSGNRFGRALGPLDHLRLHAKALGQSWIRGLKQATQIYRTT